MGGRIKSVRVGASPRNTQRVALPETVCVAAEDVPHIYRPIDAGQIRGLPYVAPAMVRLFLLDQYDDAELTRDDRHIATVLAGIRRQHARPPVQKEALLATLPHDLRGLRDRAILLLGFTGGLRRSEIVGLDRHKDDTTDSSGWIDLLDGGCC